MSRTAGYDASQDASSKVVGRVELDAAFALLAAAGHLGGRCSGRHCAYSLNCSDIEKYKGDGGIVWKVQRLPHEVAGRLVVGAANIRSEGEKLQRR